MSSLSTRKMLKKLGLLEVARSVKRSFVYHEASFMPCTPHLLIAVNKGLRWCQEKGIAEGTDYLEFGVFRGFTLWYAQALAQDMRINNMRFFGFDSFFGLPALNDVDSNGEFYEGHYYAPRKDVEKFLTYYGVDWSKTFLVEGWFDKTLKVETRSKYDVRKCALCVVDCDLYESTQSYIKN